MVYEGYERWRAGRMTELLTASAYWWHHTIGNWKGALHMLCPIMLSLYKKISHLSDFPQGWGCDFFCYFNVWNYRIISLFKIPNKGFVIIYFIRTRLGYRADHSIMDIYYCIVTDFSKAFDSAQHKLLYFIVIKNDIGGTVSSVLKSMYSKLKMWERSCWLIKYILALILCDGPVLHVCICVGLCLSLFQTLLYSLATPTPMPPPAWSL